MAGLLADEQVYRFKSNGTTEKPGRWVMRPMKYGEKIEFLREQQRLFKAAKGDDVDAAGFLAFVIDTIAKLTVRLEDVQMGAASVAWPATPDERQDLLARVPQDEINDMFEFVQSHCAGLTVAAQGN